jgi:hypothetical protein
MQQHEENNKDSLGTPEKPPLKSLKGLENHERSQ